jgi:hypothetical protein
MQLCPRTQGYMKETISRKPVRYIETIEIIE